LQQAKPAVESLRRLDCHGQNLRAVAAFVRFGSVSPGPGPYVVAGHHTPAATLAG
jgi:hypothetical protein